MSYEQLRFRINGMKRNGVDIPIKGNEKLKDTLEIMFNLDMIEKEVVKTDYKESKEALDRIRSIK